MDINLKEIPKDLRNRYEFYDYNHAFDILSRSAVAEWDEILDSLLAFSLSIDDIKKGRWK